MLRKYLWGTQGRPKFFFGGFSTFGEPNRPLSSIQRYGTIEKNGPPRKMRERMRQMCVLCRQKCSTITVYGEYQEHYCDKYIDVGNNSFISQDMMDRGSLKRSARAVQLFGRLAVLETHTLRY